MARFRNPRFVPEHLEKRLSPTGLTGLRPPAQYVLRDDPEPLPPWEPGDPPTIPPTIPTGPSTPGILVS